MPIHTTHTHCIHLTNRKSKNHTTRCACTCKEWRLSQHLPGSVSEFELLNRVVCVSKTNAWCSSCFNWMEGARPEKDAQVLKELGTARSAAGWAFWGRQSCLSCWSQEPDSCKRGVWFNLWFISCFLEGVVGAALLSPSLGLTPPPTLRGGSGSISPSCTLRSGQSLPSVNSASKLAIGQLLFSVFQFSFLLLSENLCFNVSLFRFR